MNNDSLYAVRKSKDRNVGKKSDSSSREDGKRFEPNELRWIEGQVQAERKAHAQ
jgi:hypothetical protein